MTLLSKLRHEKTFPDQLLDKTISESEGQLVYKESGSGVFSAKDPSYKGM